MYSNTALKTPPIVKSLSESLTKSISAPNKSPVTQKDVVNLLGKRGLTISTVSIIFMSKLYLYFFI